MFVVVPLQVVLVCLCCGICRGYCLCVTVLIGFLLVCDVQSLLGVEQSFEGHIDKLKPLKNDILDVKATRWHDANNAFKSGLRDLGASSVDVASVVLRCYLLCVFVTGMLNFRMWGCDCCCRAEVMLQNVINNAFDGVRTISVGVELLEAFSHLAKRPSIQRVVDKRAASMWGLLKQNMDSTKVRASSFYFSGTLRCCVNRGSRWGIFMLDFFCASLIECPGCVVWLLPAGVLRVAPPEPAVGS